jgi:hypothetical protein
MRRGSEKALLRADKGSSFRQFPGRLDSAATPPRSGVGRHPRHLGETRHNVGKSVTKCELLWLQLRNTSRNLTRLIQDGDEGDICKDNYDVLYKSLEAYVITNMDFSEVHVQDVSQVRMLVRGDEKRCPGHNWRVWSQACEAEGETTLFILAESMSKIFGQPMTAMDEYQARA